MLEEHQNYAMPAVSNGYELGRDTILTDHALSFDTSNHKTFPMPGQGLYTPKSTQLKMNWPFLNDIRIDYGDGKVISKFYAPSGKATSIQTPNGQHLMHLKSEISALSDARSLRSREAAILGQTRA